MSTKDAFDVLADCERWADQLSRSGRGKEAARVLLAAMEDCWLGLDRANVAAIQGLQTAAWHGWAGTVRDVLREMVDERVSRD